MATNFPASLDTLTNPSATDTLDSPPHDEQHADANDAIEALQAKVGVDSSAVTSSLDYKVSDHGSRLSSLEAISHGKILQVVSTTKTDTFSASVSLGSTTAITGLSATITPTLATSKVLVMLTHYGSSDGTSIVNVVNLTRGGTAIATGDTAGSRTSASGGFYYYWNVSQGVSQIMPLAINYLDSPATTSATTYGVEWVGIGNTQYLNRSNGDADAVYQFRLASTITVMEVAA
jgi:hypothetical protein